MILNHSQYKSRVPELEALFEACFHRKPNRDFFIWRYLNHPSGDLLASVETQSNRVVANYSASPCCLTAGGEPVKTALSMTTMTAPEFEGRGLFVGLARELYEHMTRKGYPVIWGFPNRNSYRGFMTKLGWRCIYEIPVMQLRLNDANQALGLSAPAGAERDDDMEFLYAEASSLKDLIHVKKDRDYLRWRYVRNPFNRYMNFVLREGNTVSSFCVVKTYLDTELDIVDFQARDAEEGRTLLSAVIGYALDHQLLQVNCWAPRHHFFHLLCMALGFMNREPITYFGARMLFPLPWENPDFLDFSNWYIQMGDSDVY
jgi:hypothetical protein